MKLSLRGKIQLIALTFIIFIVSIIKVDACCSKKIKIYTPVPDPDVDLCIYEVIYTPEVKAKPVIDEIHDVIVEKDGKEEDYSVYINEDDVELIANVIFGEARGIDSTEQKAAVAWCILNRLDSGRWGTSIYNVVSARNQFDGFNPDRRYSYDELLILHDCRKLARDVLERYYHEKFSDKEVGRVLPKDYLFFYGQDGINKFTKEWRDYDSLWDWSLESPY